jgi:hypothetical protein
MYANLGNATGPRSIWGEPGVKKGKRGPMVVEVRMKRERIQLSS